MRYKIMTAWNNQEKDRILALCDRYGVAYYVDNFRDSSGWSGCYIHLMKSSDAVEYKRKGGIWNYYIPDSYWGVRLPTDR